MFSHKKIRLVLNGSISVEEDLQQRKKNPKQIIWQQKRKVLKHENMQKQRVNIQKQKNKRKKNEKKRKKRMISQSQHNCIFDV